MKKFSCHIPHPSIEVRSPPVYVVAGVKKTAVNFLSAAKNLQIALTFGEGKIIEPQLSNEPPIGSRGMAVPLKALAKEEQVGETMSRMCELTGKGVLSGNNVSHANNKTRRKFLPNLCRVTLMSEATGMSYRLRVSAAALRSVEHRGGLDAFLLKSGERDLSPRARLLRKEIIKKTAEQAAA